MPANRRRHLSRPSGGFTLIELMITVVIIGLLAAIAIPNYFRFIRNSKVGRTASELRSLSQGFVAYYASNGQYPPDSHLSLPPGMEDYISPSIWSDGTPMGGTYNWEGPNFYPYAGLAIFFSGTPPTSDLVMLDRLLDDGNLTTGQFRIGTTGKPTLIIEE